MVDYCCAPGCQNSRGKTKTKGKSFYRIPKDPERRNKWIAAIKRARGVLNKTERWEPTSNGFRLCSDHFISGAKSENPLSPDYIPSIFEHTSTAEKKRRNMLLDTFSRRQKAKRQRRAQPEKSSAAPVHWPVTSL
ncbi:hypothetical protein AALO_G00273140, partial [Alosa alosa]